jgi:hypothetical protein
VTNLLFDSAEHANAAALTSQFIQYYLATVADRPVYPHIDREALRVLLNAPIPQTPTTLDASSRN